MIRQHQLDPNLVKAYATDFCAVKTLREATREQVETFVTHLADWAEKDRNALPFRPCAVSATGLSHVPGGTKNIAYLTLFFEGSQIAYIHSNWLASVKLRTLIGASRKMIVYDDLEQSEKIKV